MEGRMEIVEKMFESESEWRFWQRDRKHGAENR